MPLPSDADRAVAEGPHGTVEFAVKSPARMAEAWDWKEDLQPQKWASFCVLFQRLLDKGEIHNTEQFRYLSSDVCEFKRGGDRLLCFRIGNRFLLTNTLKKNGRKIITEDIERSKKIAEGHLAWEKSRSKHLPGQ